MNPLICQINAHKEMNDPALCEELILFIEKRGIVTEDELRQRENDSYTPVDEERLPDGEILARLYMMRDFDYDDYMALSREDQALLDSLDRAYDHSRVAKERFRLLILMYRILSWDNPLPWHTYRFILEDRL